MVDLLFDLDQGDHIQIPALTTRPTVSLCYRNERD